MGKAGLLVAAFLIAFVCAAAAQAQRAGPIAEEGEVRIEAEEVSYDQRANTIVARGNVIIRRGDMELHADEVRLNRTTNDAAARGHVSIIDPNGAIFADQVQLNL